jgi:hypothetical protein
MLTDQYFITLESESEQAADVGAQTLADNLREIKGVLSADRIKENKNTMDLGAIIGVLATSGATLALAQGIADWLRLRRSTTLVIEKDGATNSIKATVNQIDPEAAKRIIEMIRNS